MMEEDPSIVVAPVRYAVTEGWEGPVVAGPYLTYDNAVMARSTMFRPWRMFWRGIPYVVQPVDKHGKIWPGVGAEWL